MTTKRVTKVLLAEDMVASRRPVAHYLRDQGFDVLETGTPRETIRALSRDQFDVMLLDLKMPDDNPEGGKQVLEYLNGSASVIAVVLLTNYGHNGLVASARRTFKRDIAAVINKPSDLDTIVSTIRAAVPTRS